MEKDAAAIFKAYLSTTSVESRTVNLADDVSERLLKNMRSFHSTGTHVDVAKREQQSRETWPVPQVRTPFDEPQEVVYALMETDSLRRFVKTEQGHKAMKIAHVA